MFQLQTWQSKAKRLVLGERKIVTFRPWRFRIFASISLMGDTMQ